MRYFGLLAASAALIAATGSAFASQRVTVDADPLEFSAIVSTMAVEKKMRPLDKTSWGDNYLRATIDKRTARTSIEVVQRLRHWGPARDYHTVHYRNGKQLERAALRLAQVDAANCGNRPFSAECIINQEVSFAIDEGLLRDIAGQPGGTWQFKIKDRDEKDLTAAVSSAEAADLLRALEAGRASGRWASID